jgi:integrase
MRQHLIKAEIDRFTCPPGRKDVLIFDTLMRGFGVRVTASGRKIFILQYKRSGVVRRAVIGVYGEITVAQARREAETLRGAVQGGADPVAARNAVEASERAAVVASAARETFTVDTLLDRWAAIGLKDRSAAHRYDAPRAVRRLLGANSAMPAEDITVPMVQALVDAMLPRAPVLAIRTRNYGRAAFNWAIRRNLVSSNPFTAVEIDRRERSRDRLLNVDELRGAWRAAEAMDFPFGPLIQLMILTLQRKGEVTGMGWSELSPDCATWTIPARRAKNGRAHSVHLVQPARAILRAIPRQHDADGAEIDLVFTTTGKTAVSGFKSGARILRRKVLHGAAHADETPPAIDWTLHDFRRTGVSKMAELGIAPHIADRILNHVTGTIRGVMATYQRYDFKAERQRALEIWAAHVLEVAEGTSAPSNVAKFKPRDI